LKPKEKSLKDVQKIILDRNQVSDSKLTLLKNLKKQIDAKRGATYVPLEYADKIRSILNLNLLLVYLFTPLDIKDDAGTSIQINKTKGMGHNTDILTLLNRSLMSGGINTTPRSRTSIMNAKSEYKHNNILELQSRIQGNQDLQNILIFSDGDKGNKCSIIQNTSSITLSSGEKIRVPSLQLECNNSIYYESHSLNKLDLDAQYYLVTELLNQPELPKEERLNLVQFKEKLEYQCQGCPGDLYGEPRAGKEYIQNRGQYINNGFFSDTQAIENYKWLIKYVHKNKIHLNENTLRYILDKYNDLRGASNILDEDLARESQYFPEVPISTDPIQCGLLDNLGKNYDDYFSNLDTTLNEYVLNKQNCNNDYLGQFKESYI
jgi:hypothetical protein